MNQSIHTIDLLLYLMGPVKNVRAETPSIAHKSIEVEDTAVAILEFETGRLVLFKAPQVAGHVQDILPKFR